jgi:hypothetical protein
MKLKSFFLRMSISIVILLMATDLFAQTGYAAPGGTWIPATKSWRGSTTTQGSDPWTLTPRTGLIDEPYPFISFGVGPDSVVRQVFPTYYMSERVQGFLEYLPSGYNLPANSTKRYPLIIYVPGCGEVHDGRVYTHTNGNPNWNYGIFRLMKTDGGTQQFASLPRELVRNGDYFSAVPLKTPGQVYNPTTGPKQGVIVMCLMTSHRTAGVCGAQNSTYYVANKWDIDRAINLANTLYRVDNSKIYLTGMSAGGGVSYNYVGDTDFPELARKIAGIVPVAAVENLYGDVNRAAVTVNNGVNVMAVVNRRDYNSSVIQNNRSTIQAFESIPGVAPDQIDSSFFLLPGQNALSCCDHNAWTIAYQTRGSDGQIPATSGTRFYTYTDPVSLERYTTYEWMISRQNLRLLPVAVSSFTATRENNGVKLAWSTSTEINSDKFIIERSTNGTSFSLLTEVAATGNSNTTVRYSHLDANLPQSTYVYYRLSQRDKNGKLQIIGVKKVYLGGQGYEIAIYPTVATSTVNIEIQGSVNEPITVNVVDMAGRQLSQHVIAPRQNRLTINTDKLSKGMYIVQINGGGKTQTSKFVKQ